MSKWLKAFSLAMTVLASVGEAMDPKSEEGATLTQREIVRVAVRTIFAAAGTFGADISNLPEGELQAIIQQEVMAATMMA